MVTGEKDGTNTKRSDHTVAWRIRFIGDLETVRIAAIDDFPTESVESRVQTSRAQCIGCSLNATNRSEEHTSELQSLMRISYAVFCLKKKNNTSKTTN